MFIVVSYDISHTKRRNRLHRALKNFGTRVQYSVFECVLCRQGRGSGLRRRCGGRFATTTTCAITTCASHARGRSWRLAARSAGRRQPRWCKDAAANGGLVVDG